MLKLRFCVDRCDADQVAGWIDHDGPISPLTIEINGRWVCDLSPTQYRADLRDAGFEDGRRGFIFPLAGYLIDLINTVSLKVRDTEIYSKDIVYMTPESASSKSAIDSTLLEYSQRRWKGDEPDMLLTWGSIMDGESLWNVYKSARQFRAADKILEIGPGYGRLLSTAIDQKVPFASYVGVELSQSRVDKLRARFKHSGVGFFVGDVNNWRSDVLFDIIICSSTFEHLYPNCKNALCNLRTQLAGDGLIFIDFVYSEESRFWFDSPAFVRCYTECELREIFEGSGFDVINLVPCVLGTAATGQPIKRNVVIAQQLKSS